MESMQDLEVNMLELELEEGEVIPMDDQDSEDNINVIMHEKSRQRPPPVAAHWTNISKKWRVEESIKGRIGGAHATHVSATAAQDQREIINYEEVVGGRAHDRLDFQRRRPTTGAKREARRELNEISDDSDGEDEVESEMVNYTKRLLGPRMKMYADEEEENRQRVAKIKRMYGGSGNSKEEKGRSLVVTVDADDYEEEERPHPRGRQHEHELNCRPGCHCRYEDETPVRRVQFPRSPSPFPIRNVYLARCDGEHHRIHRSPRSLSPDHRRSRRRHRTRDRGERSERTQRTGVSRHQSLSRSHRHRPSAYSSSPSLDRRPVSRRVGMAARLDTRHRSRSRTPRSRRGREDHAYERERDREATYSRQLRPQNIGCVYRGPTKRDDRRTPIKERLG